MSKYVTETFRMFRWNDPSGMKEWWIIFAVTRWKYFCTLYFYTGGRWWPTICCSGHQQAGELWRRGRTELWPVAGGWGAGRRDEPHRLFIQEETQEGGLNKGVRRSVENPEIIFMKWIYIGLACLHTSSQHPTFFLFK